MQELADLNRIPSGDPGIQTYKTTQVVCVDPDATNLDYLDHVVSRQGFHLKSELNR